MQNPLSNSRAELERDLYLRLLSLGRNDALEPFLNEALELVMELTAARVGFLELFPPDDAAPGSDAGWRISRSCSDQQIEDIRALVSSGVIAKSLATGTTVRTSSALLDPEFASRRSVQRNAIQAVLCVPVGSPPIGVLYLQDREEPGPFSDPDARAAELFAQHVSPLARKLTALAEHSAGADPTREARRTLQHEGLIGRSRAFAATLDLLAAAAKSDVTVLLTGETGTGKSLLARAIHASGARAAGPFIEVNCGAITPTLYESEFFGHVRGAFTNALRDRVGRFAAADGGTLFLDEIAEVPLELQSKLLRALHEGVIERVGENQTRRVDVRVIAATNTDLEKAVKDGLFRQDLYFRLRVFPARVPALRERREDIPELARHLVSRHCARYGAPHVELTASALHALQTAEWPGNIRELEGVLERAIVIAKDRGETTLTRADIFPEDTRRDSGEPPATFHAAMRAFQRDFLRTKLEEHDWNVAKTAQTIETARSYLYKLIDAHDLASEIDAAKAAGSDTAPKKGKRPQS
jgi:Nif-specific regulatory protein